MSYITWLQLAARFASPSAQTGGPAILVRPIDLDKRRPAFGVTVDQKWLRGGDGAFTLFDSLAAATRFLRLLKVDRIAFGHDTEDVVKGGAFRCFGLNARGLAECVSPCHPGSPAHPQGCRRRQPRAERAPARRHVPEFGDRTLHHQSN